MVKIATAVWKAEDFTLQDGTDVTVKPLNIKRLREFMKVISHLGEGETQEEIEENTISCIFNAAVIALTKDNPKVVEDEDNLQEILDVPTIHKILEVAGGVKLGSGNENLIVTE